MLHTHLAANSQSTEIGVLECLVEHCYKNVYQTYLNALELTVNQRFLSANASYLLLKKSSLLGTFFETVHCLISNNVFQFDLVKHTYLEFE